MKSNLESRSIINLLKPWGMVFILFTFTLGASLAHYLGGRINLLDLLSGFIICLLIWSMRHFLGAYFDHPESYHSSLNLNDPDRGNLLNIRRGLLLLYTLLILTAGATLTTILIFRGVFNAGAILWLGVALLLNFFSVAPPLRLSQNGYGELVEALYIANLVPAIAFSLVEPSPSVLIVELTLPLTFIFMAMKIALEFKAYGFDGSHGRQSLVTRVGWQNALVMHNLFLLSAYVLLGIFLLLGLPWSLTWPPLLTLPFGGLQMFHLIGISNGASPKWRYLTWLAIGLFLLIVYMMSISLWL